MKDDRKIISSISKNAQDHYGRISAWKQSAKARGKLGVAVNKNILTGTSKCSSAWLPLKVLLILMDLAKSGLSFGWSLLKGEAQRLLAKLRRLQRHHSTISYNC